jgi:hypothetical protein
MSPWSPPPPLGHPENALLFRLLTSVPGRDLPVFQHLLDCRHCRVRLRPLLAERTGGPAGPDSLWEQLEGSLREKVETLEREAGSPGERLADREEEAERRLAELLALPADERREAILADERFRSWGLSGQLLEIARSAGRTDPTAGREWLYLALDLAEQLDPEGTGEGPAAGLVARAHCYFAESLALGGDLSGAESAFELAALHLEGTADPSDRAWYCHLLSRLRAEQGRSDEAAALAGRAAALFAGLGEVSEAAAALVDELRLLLSGWNPELALERIFATLPGRV